MHISAPTGTRTVHSLGTGRYNGPPISHLFFADELLLSTKATTDQIEGIMDCLDKLCDLSGQRVSRPKSSITFSTGIDAEVATRISNISKIPITNNLERHHEIPSIMGRVNYGQFKHILDRMEGRLEGWKAKNLTLVGRVVLAKSMLASTPIYMMQSTLLLKMLCNTIDKKIHNPPGKMGDCDEKKSKWGARD